MKTRILILILFISSAARALPVVDEGKAIFTARCAACHNVNKIVTGPALAGVEERRSVDWIISFVHSSQTLVKSGDPTAVELFNKFNNIPMPDHPDLTPDNIKNILAYIKSETKMVSDAAPFARPAKLHPAYVPLTINNYGFFLSYFGLVGVLILVLLMAVRTKEYERSTQKD